MSLLIWGAAAPASGTSTLVLLAVIFAAIYLLSVWFYPFAPCRVCRGTPKSAGWLFPRTFDLCRHCDGRGRRVRFGARLFGRNRDIN